MLFNSYHFALFFPLVVIIYFLLPSKKRWILLLVASYYFYMSWKVEYILLIVISTLVDYWASINMPKATTQRKKKILLLLSLFTNLGILVGFKYFNFISDNLNSIIQKFNLFAEIPYFDVLLPVGISFYTFQTMSYTIDVYKEKIQPEKHLGIFAVYVSFFPQLVAGPIERAGTLLPQFRKDITFDYQNVKQGLLLMAWGFFKKIVIADRLAAFVNPVYNDLSSYDGITTLIASYSFAFQIYCDFSGYSDIAIGAALIMGYRLMTNFRRPYFSTSIKEFWSRWHISLSTWFRDYVYIPLGGNRVVKWRWYYNLFITFLVSGIWHGANWTFVVWGALHGLYLISESFLGKYWGVVTSSNSSYLKNAIHVVKVIFVFHLVLIGWVIFRSNQLSDVAIVFQNIISIHPGDLFNVVKELVTHLGWLNYVGKPEFLTIFEVRIAIFTIVIMELAHLLQERKILTFVKFIQLNFAVRWVLYLALVIVIITFGKFNEVSDFIYFQF